MFPNAKASEMLTILATLDPASQAAGTATTGWISVANHHGLMASVQSGALGASATLDAKFQQAQDSSGTGAKDITGKDNTNKAITQLTQAASGSNRQVLINLKPEELDTVNGFGFVRLFVTVGVAPSITSAQLIGVNPRYAPADSLNQAAVAQVV
jgi:Skp family chaperone for outer membrane proteins